MGGLAFFVQVDNLVVSNARFLLRILFSLNSLLHTSPIKEVRGFTFCSCCECMSLFYNFLLLEVSFIYHYEEGRGFTFCHSKHCEERFGELFLLKYVLDKS